MKNGAFTLVELLVVIGILAILLTVTLVAINPTVQFKSAREAKRTADATMLLDSLTQYVIDEKGENPFPHDNISRYIAQGEYKGKYESSPKPVLAPNIDLCEILSPTYTAMLPSDPLLETEVSDCDNYYTGYMLTVTTEGKIIVSAPLSEINPIVFVR